MNEAHAEYIRLRNAYIETSAHMGSVSWSWNRGLIEWSAVSFATANARDAYDALNHWEATHTAHELANAEHAYWENKYQYPEVA